MRAERLAEIVQDRAWHFVGAATDHLSAIEHASLLGFEQSRLFGALGYPKPAVVKTEGQWTIYQYQGS